MGRIYGEPLTALYSLLHNLRLNYREYNKANPVKRFIDIPGFGIRIRLGVSTPVVSEDDGMDVMFYHIDMSPEEKNDFGETLMWKLISSGYMHYIRNHGNNGEHLYNQLLSAHGWGIRILKKRLEYWSGKQDKKYIREALEETIDKLPIIEIGIRFPGIFDYLY